MLDPQQFYHFASLMKKEGMPEIFINTFSGYYDQLLAGHTGMISESEISPVPDLPDAENLPDELTAVGADALAKCVVIKLNGGLGTSMGLEQAKSLLVVKDGLSFLDITARQTILARVPLILMNSYATDADSLAMLSKYQELDSDLPKSFLQHKQPKVRQSDLMPANWPADPDLEWCPPGHGDIYTALVTSGVLEKLLRQGYEYAFVSNADNLGAVIDTKILGHFARRQLPFMMEVADRTYADKKGGHLAMRADGQLILREVAQTAEEDLEQFQNVERYRYFNTNNLWLNLRSLQSLMAAQSGILGLPMIRNVKTVDPRDPTSALVYQLETAMGSAIGVFKGAEALRVPRTRFAPVKKTNDLLAVRSDAFILTEEFHVQSQRSKTASHLQVELDPRFYQFVSDLDHRFPFGPPSLAACSKLIIDGEFIFGRDVVCSDDVHLVNRQPEPQIISDGTMLSGPILWK